MFHVELRQFPHQTRAFNLTREQLLAGILLPWVADEPVQLSDRTWSPRRTRISIYEGPALGPDEIGLGRGWAKARRDGAEVTARLLEEARQISPATRLDAQLQHFKELVVARSEQGEVELRQVLALANERYSQWRVSDRVALAERSVWELLHQGRLEMHSSGSPVGADRWAPLLLRWETWDAEEVTLTSVPFVARSQGV